MTYTYDLAAEDPATLNISMVRLELGDNIQNVGVRPDGSNLTDEEIAVWLEKAENDIDAAIGRACAALAKMWTNVANITVGPRREDLGQIAKGWADRAKEAAPYGDSYSVTVVPIDQTQDPYKYRPEEESEA